MVIKLKCRTLEHYVKKPMCWHIIAVHKVSILKTVPLQLTIIFASRSYTLTHLCFWHNTTQQQWQSCGLNQTLSGITTIVTTPTVYRSWWHLPGKPAQACFYLHAASTIMEAPAWRVFLSHIPVATWVTKWQQQNEKVKAWNALKMSTNNMPIVSIKWMDWGCWINNGCQMTI